MSRSFKYFNSIKVRLKHPFVAEDGAVLEFQFHKGTIKTHLRAVYIGGVLDFNSIKVRLKQSVSKNDLMKREYFNSIKVRLKPEVAGFLDVYITYISIP